MVNFSVLLEELMGLREDFNIPCFYSIVLISEETCMLADKHVKTTDPEERLLASSVFRNGEFDRLITRLLGNIPYSFEVVEVNDSFIVLTFPPSFSGRASFAKIVRRTVKQLEMRFLVSERMARMELKIAELSAQVNRQHEEARREVRQIIRQWMSENTVEVAVQPGVIELLKGETEVDIRTRLTASLQLEQFMHPDHRSFEITVENLQQKSSAPVEKQSSAAEKTELLLNRYEAAARKALEMNRKLNGKNIAVFCDPPISPPAVTDSLQKHKRQMERLLAEHPEKWINARRGLKPLREIDEKLKYNAA